MKIIKWFKSLFHQHTFSIRDLFDLGNEAKCTCGKTLSECAKEKGYKLGEEKLDERIPLL
jgi:hypothetical protein